MARKGHHFIDTRMLKTLLSFLLGGLSAILLTWLVLNSSQTRGPLGESSQRPATIDPAVRSGSNGPQSHQAELHPGGAEPLPGRSLSRKGPEASAEAEQAEPGSSAVLKRAGSDTEDHPDKSLDTAQAWFARGVALNNDSELEMACYLKAVQFDPGFAPAYYRLGALQMRNGEFAKAKKAFAAFWVHATDREKQEYNLTLFTSLEELDLEIAALTGEAEEPNSQTEGDLVEVESDQGQIIVPVFFGRDVKARMILDTGAAITVISPQLAEKAGFRPGGTIRLTTIAHGSVNARSGTVPSMKIGNREKRNVRVAVSDIGMLGGKGIDGLAGMDLLRDTGIRIERDRNMIELR
jgi:predicted aspartyl protease